MLLLHLMGSQNFITISDMSKLKSPSFGTYNIQSAANKISDVSVILRMSHLDYLRITESWLSNRIVDMELPIPGYNIFRFDRDNGLGNRQGGGILIYTSLKYKFTELLQINVCNSDFESLWRRMDLKATRHTYICCVYCPTTGGVID